MKHGWIIAGLAIVTGVQAACEVQPSTEADRSGERVFVETLGVDTIAVESFSRTDSLIVGTVVSRNPRTSVVRYTAELDAEGRISRLEAEWLAGDALDAPATSRATVTVDGGTARVVRERSQGTDTVAVDLEDAFVPSLERLPLATAMVDHAARLAVADSASSMPISILSPLAARVSPNVLALREDGHYTLSYFGKPQLITVDENGAVQSISGRETTNRVEIQPAGSLNVTALAADFAARDAAGEGLGVPSPTDTARATIDGTELEIVYSRPAMRGREIWGGLVPYGEVWRTGANAATQFSTSGPIRLGDLDLPAGTYTLWSTYSADTATLIVNSETGQWGTAYDAARDFGTVDLEQRPVGEPVERFTIEFADGPELRLVWADRMYVAPIAVR